MIDKIGAELEFGTNYADKTILRNVKGTDITGDGSIHAKKATRAREILLQATKIKDIDGLKQRVLGLKKYVNETNNSMGFHIHVSFKNHSDYAKIYNYNFYREFIKEYAKNFTTKEELSRLNNSYCSRYKSLKHFSNNTSQQVLSEYKSNRYFAVNYNSYNIHNTIEFRIFPANNPERLIQYIDFTVNFIKDWLKKSRMKTSLVYNLNLRKRSRNIEKNDKELIEV